MKPPHPLSPPMPGSNLPPMPMPGANLLPSPVPRIPHPYVLDDLCNDYPNSTREEILSWWMNATRHFHLLPEHKLCEPPEVTAARALWVRGNLERHEPKAWEYLRGCFVLVDHFSAVTRGQLQHDVSRRNKRRR